MKTELNKCMIKSVEYTICLVNKATGKVTETPFGASTYAKAVEYSADTLRIWGADEYDIKIIKVLKVLKFKK